MLWLYVLIIQQYLIQNILFLTIFNSNIFMMQNYIYTVTIIQKHLMSIISSDDSSRKLLNSYLKCILHEAENIIVSEKFSLKKYIFKYFEIYYTIN